jgi:curli biogenesis system outer membrane secretion channel CsgG
MANNTRSIVKTYLFIFTIFCFSISVCLGGDYLAYVQDEKKGEVPLPENIDDLEAKDILNMRWGEYTGPKSRVAVLPVKNDSDKATITISGPDGETTIDYSDEDRIPVQGIDAIITDSLLQSGRFRLVERVVLKETMKEQDLGASGRVAQPSAAKTGNILGAQYQVQAVVTNYEPGVKKKSGGLGGLLGGRTSGVLGGVGIKSDKSVVGMNFRLIDATTSEVVFTKQVESILSEKGLSFGGAGGGYTGGTVAALGGFMSNYSKTPIGQAVIATINKGTYELAKQVGVSPATGSVVRASEDKIYTNLGEGIVSVGEILKVMSKGEELIDPETGISLGSEKTELGTIKIVSIQEKFSIAEPVGINTSDISPGDQIVSTKPAGELEFGPDWK